jgi:hypothetical protein
MVGLVNAKARGAIEFAGSKDYLDGSGTPLLALQISINGTPVKLGAGGMAWEREFSWIPTFSCMLGNIAVKGTIFSPCGRDADLPCAVVAVSVENRGTESVRISVGASGTLGHRQHRIRYARDFDDRHIARKTDDPYTDTAVILEGSAIPGFGALAIAPGSDCGIEVDESTSSWSTGSEGSLAAGGKSEHGFLIACGAEADGAIATLDAIQRTGWGNLLESTRKTLQRMEQSTSERSVDRLINRNLMFAFFTGIARAIDDGRIYPVRSRMPWNGRGLTITDWDALIWLLPAVQLADPEVAREVLLRMCEVHGHSPGRGVNYLDGTLFAPGFSLEGVASYAIAVDEYIVQTGDDRVVDDPILAETLYGAHEIIERRKHATIPLYSTEVNPDFTYPSNPYTVHGNAVAAFALEVFSRTLDEKTAEKVQDAEAVRASALRHFSIEGPDGRTRFISSTDLRGQSQAGDNHAASSYWLPYFHLIGRDDSRYRRTVKQWEDSPSELLLERCARLIGPNSSEVLDWLRRAPLDNGVAAEFVAEDGRAKGDGGDAVLSAMVAYLAWYAVHALGAKV